MKSTILNARFSTRLNTRVAAKLTLLGGLLLAASTASAAPGRIANTPLFVGQTPQSNVMFLVDDSGSMGWHYLYQNRAFYNQDRRTYSCSGVNAMWYNPQLYLDNIADPENTKLEDRLGYTPWKGVDRFGQPYTNRTLQTALADPYNNPNTHVNISYWGYYPWIDNPVGPTGQGNGVYEPGECRTDQYIYAHTLSPEQQIDYANWYTYYRRRDYVAKRALSEVIQKNDMRMGMATLHNNNNVGVPVRNIDDLSTPVNEANRTNKANLMRNLFRLRPRYGTPLRTSLARVGQYFDQRNGTPGSLFGGQRPASPILPESQNGACQQNFAIVMSDGYWNGGSPGVGNADGDNNTQFDGGRYGDRHSNTLADVAMRYYEGDLAPGLENLVGPEQETDADGNAPDPLLNRAQHLVTYTVAFGVQGTLSEPALNNNWPRPRANNATTIDDMLHAAHNARGEFLSAKNPAELIERLNDAISSIENAAGSAAGLALSSNTLRNGAAVFQTLFKPQEAWSGDLRKQALSRNGNELKFSLEWSAAEKLKSIDPNTRQVLTYNSSYRTGVPFRFPAFYFFPGRNELSSVQVSDLLRDAPHENFASVEQFQQNVTYGQRLIAYIRGDHTYEQSVANNSTISANFGKVFRYRQGERLGAIAHSSPLYVDRPNAGYPDDIEGGGAKSYAAFVERWKNRKPMVYVGANDGMLHGFNADSGEEQFAYIPGLVFSREAAYGLHYLASVNFSHIPYVDGSPNVKDVFVNGAWRSYLVGALRGGGRGVYVLDVTNPDNVDEGRAGNIAKGEFVHNDMGFGYSQPQIVRLNNGRWAAVFGNGYNSSRNGDGHAKLFILYLDGNQVGDYKIIETKASGAAPLIVDGDCLNPASDCNGLSTPLVVDTDGDYTADRVYAGDLHGNLWAFDLSSENDADWDVAHRDGSRRQPLFQACYQQPCYANGKVANRQPITTKPVIKPNTRKIDARYAPSLLVYVGTGQFVADSDPSNTNVQSAYAVWDSGQGGLSRDNLVRQTTSAIGDNRTMSENTVAYDERRQQAGWFIDLPQSRERIINPMSVGHSAVLFTTIIPDAATCNGNPDGFVMAVNAFTGGKLPFKAFINAKTGQAQDISGKRVGGMPSGLGFVQAGDGKANALYTDQKGGLYNIMVAGPDVPSRLTSWNTVD